MNMWKCQPVTFPVLLIPSPFLRLHLRYCTLDTGFEDQLKSQALQSGIPGILTEPRSLEELAWPVPYGLTGLPSSIVISTLRLEYDREGWHLKKCHEHLD